MNYFFEKFSFSQRLFILLFLTYVQVGFSQEYRFQVQDLEGQPLPYATIQGTSYEGRQWTQQADAQGRATVQDIFPGTHYVVIIHDLVYSPTLLIDLDPKKSSQVITLRWEAPKVFLEDLQIVSSRFPYLGSTVNLYLDQHKNELASFQDPTRTLIRYPGVAMDNDGANQIIYRGLAPELTRWQLHGADVLNPNHLSNAGTLSDLATGSGGGVNALSGSVLGKFDFLPAPAGIELGESMSGTSNLQYAEGIQNYVDLNFIGFEAGVNFGNENLKRYINYRYSFVGILEKLGASFGNESINYQDLSFYADLHKNQQSHWKMYATLGNSKNFFSGEDSLSNVETFKDLSEINLQEYLAIIGTQFSSQLGAGKLEATLNFSYRDSERRSLTRDDYRILFPELLTASNNQYDQLLLSAHLRFQQPIQKGNWAMGVRGNFSNTNATADELSNQMGGSLGGYNYFRTYFQIYPYAEWQHRFSDRLRMKLGIGASILERVADIRTNTAASLEYDLNEAWGLFATNRRSSQIFQTLQQSVLDDIPQISGDHFDLGMRWAVRNRLVKVSAFMHRLNDTPVDQATGYHLLNGVPDYLSFSGVIYEGRSEMYGLQAYYQDRWNIDTERSLYWSGAASYMDGQHSYQGIDQVNRFNFSHMVNLQLGYKREKYGPKYRSWSYQIAWYQRGGMYALPIDLERSEEFKATITDLTGSFDQRLMNYQRIDFRFIHERKKTGSRFTHRWSIDIQNLLSRENEAWVAYDPLLRDQILQRQLGMIPVFSYRLMW